MQFREGEALPTEIFHRLDDWFVHHPPERDSHPSVDARIQGWPFRCFHAHIIVDHGARPIRTCLVYGAICHTDSEPTWVSPHVVSLPSPEIVLAYKPLWGGLAANISIYSIISCGVFGVVGTVRHRARARNSGK